MRYLKGIVLLSATMLLLAVVEPKSIGKKSRTYRKGAFEMIEEANKNSNEFERDIVLNPEQKKFMSDYKSNHHDNERQRREALTNTFQKWENARLPYEIDSSIDEDGRKAIAESIAVYDNKTCIRVVPRESTDNNYVVFKKLGGCFSYVGKIGGAQDISIGEGCQFLPVVLHEINHALGFFHEQSRLDRDDHVTIVSSNINPDFLDQFDKHPQGIADNLGSPYDYTGIMHYSNNAFAVDRSQPTLISKRVAGERLGGSQTLTDIDIAQLNKYYECPATTDKPTTEGPTTDGPTTDGPTTDGPSTDGPSTDGPTTAGTSTQKPETERPTTQEPETEGPTTKEPETEKPTTKEPETEGPTTQEPETEGPTTEEPTDEPTTEGPTTEEPTTEGPTTTTAPICKDRHVCAVFQRFASVVCPRFTFFRENCPVMCDTCDEGTTKKRCDEFSDRRGFFQRAVCKFRAKTGYCTSRYYQSWMVANCAKSCCKVGHLFD